MGLPGRGGDGLRLRPGTTNTSQRQE